MSPPSAAARARHPHLGDPCPQGWVRVDMHSHTMWSGDSTTTPDELAAAVDDSGVDVLCITDHQTIDGARHIGRVLDGTLGARVVVGEELRTRAGELIGLFLDEPLAAGSSPRQAAAAIRAQGGLVYVPHPFDPMRHCLSRAALDDLFVAGLVDALEVFNAKTSPASLNTRAVGVAAEHGIAAGAGSDAHVPAALGAAYVEMPDFDGPDSFLDSLRRGRVVGHHWDEPRPWSARIVPSTARR